MSKKEKETKNKTVKFMIKLPLLHRTKMAELAHEKYMTMQQLFNLAITEILKGNNKI
jgi:hypothetical protein